MSRKILKVWGVSAFPRPENVQQRCIVAAYTKKRAAELIGVSLHYFNGYASETGNKEECEMAIAKPETVFACRRHTYNDIPWHEVKVDAVARSGRKEGA